MLERNEKNRLGKRKPRVLSSCPPVVAVLRIHRGCVFEPCAHSRRWRLKTERVPHSLRLFDNSGNVIGNNKLYIRPFALCDKENDDQSR